MPRPSTPPLVFSIALRRYDVTFRACIDTQRAYCARAGYDYTLINEAPRPVEPVEAAWLKVALLRSALAAGRPWVTFLDADCEVRLHAPPFHTALEADGGDVFVAHGFSGRINSGVVFVRNTEAAQAFLDILLDHADAEMPPEDRSGIRFENGHFIHFGKSSPVVRILDHRLWNNNRALDESSYIQHYSGGVLRPWYMENVAPRPGRVVRVGTRLLARLRRRLSPPLPGPPPEQSLRSRLQGLLPFYQRRYSAFDPAA